jgi:Ca2+-binding EF-hand superfamily protein
MDQDKDGVISKNDLKDLYATLGSVSSDSQLENMLREAPGPINFTVFLTLFGERLTGRFKQNKGKNEINFVLKFNLIENNFTS